MVKKVKYLQSSSNTRRHQSVTICHMYTLIPQHKNIIRPKTLSCFCSFTPVTNTRALPCQMHTAARQRGHGHLLKLQEIISEASETMSKKMLHAFCQRGKREGKLKIYGYKSNSSLKQNKFLLHSLKCQCCRPLNQFML